MPMITAIGRQLAVVTWSLPALRNTLLRLVELVTAAETDGDAARGPSRNTHGVEIQIERVTVLASGHEVLKDIDRCEPNAESVGFARTEVDEQALSRSQDVLC